MITTTFGFLAFVFASLAFYLWFTGKYKLKLFNYIPPFLILYLVFVCLVNFGLFYMGEGSAPKATRVAVNTYIVPLLVYVVVVQCNARKIIALGPKLLATFLVTAGSIFVGILISGLMFHSKLAIPDFAGTLGALCGSFIGGPENLFAVANAVGLSDAGLGNALILIEVVYSPWLIFLICGLPLLAKKFNKWNNADLTGIIAAGDRIVLDERERTETTTADLYIVLGIGLALECLAVVGCNWLSKMVPSIPATVAMYIVVTAVSLILGTYTNLGKNPACKPLGSFFALLLVVIGTLGVDFSMLKGAGYLLITSVVALLIHIVIMVIYAKFTRTDLYTLGCASIAAIGGNSSAAVVAGAYDHKAYVSIAVVMAAVGSIIGTIGGLCLVRIFGAILG